MQHTTAKYHPAVSCGLGNNMVSVLSLPVPGLFPLGCYDGNPSFVSHVIGCVEPFACQTTCRHGGFLYAALQSGRQCSCAQSLLPSISALNASHCALPCHGDTEQVCGGATNVNIFATNYGGSTCTSSDCPAA